MILEETASALVPTMLFWVGTRHCRLLILAANNSDVTGNDITPLKNGETGLFSKSPDYQGDLGDLDFAFLRSYGSFGLKVLV